MSYRMRWIPAVLGWAWPVLPAVFYFRSGSSRFFEPMGLAPFFGIVALGWMFTALILSTRIRFPDHLYGQNLVMRHHSVMALSALVLAILHRQLKVSRGQVRTPQTIIGVVALLIIALITAITLLFMVKNLVHRIGFLDRLRSRLTSGAAADYSRLKILHNLLPVAVWGAALHGLLASSTRGHGGRTVFIAGTAVLTLLFYIRFKFIRPARLKRRIYTVSSVRKPGAKVTEIRFTGPPFPFRAGQYAYWRLTSRAVPPEEHPFTIGTSPAEAEIGFSARALGNYTDALSEVRVGDTAVIDGPWGRFVLPGGDSPVLLIAGGIGIMPFRSMVRHLADSRSLRPVTLIRAVRIRSDLVYADEFLEFTRRLPGFRYRPVIQIQDAMNVDGTIADFESGFVTAGLVRELCPDLVKKETTVYLCCPEPMRRAVLKILKELAVPRSRIRSERFGTA